MTESCPRTKCVLGVVLILAVFASGDVFGGNAASDAGGESSAGERSSGASAVSESKAGILDALVSGRRYVRAGAGAERSHDTKFFDCDIDPGSRVRLYGCGTGPDGRTYGAYGDFGSVTGFELGLGTAVSNRVRVEGVLQHRPDIAFRGESNFLAPNDQYPSYPVTAKASATTALISAYLDLPAMSDADDVRLFLGAGVGLSYNRIGTTQMNFRNTATVIPGGGERDLAWTLSAGAARPLTDRLTLEVALRITDLGAVTTPSGGGYVIWRDGRGLFNPDNPDINQGKSRARLRTSGLWISLRHAF